MLKKYTIALATFVACVFAILSVLPESQSVTDIPTVNSRAVWGIGEDGTRITPQPETIVIRLK